MNAKKEIDSCSAVISFFLCDHLIRAVVTGRKHAVRMRIFYCVNIYVIRIILSNCGKSFIMFFIAIYVREDFQLLFVKSNSSDCEKRNKNVAESNGCSFE
jgi:hypothetical protein